MTTRFDVYWWDHDVPGWHRHRAAIKKWTVRRVLRRLYKRGWSHLSVLVQEVP